MEESHTKDLKESVFNCGINSEVTVSCGLKMFFFFQLFGK